MRRVSPRAIRQTKGFGYLGLMFVIAVLTVAAGATSVVWHVAAQREKERQLLFVGDQFRRAIGSYYQSAPSGPGRFPPKLEDLLRDPRYPHVVRHLRMLYRDPLTNSQEWGLIVAPDGGIAGVHSLSEQKPLRTYFPDVIYADFDGKQRYSDWQFVFRPEGVQRPPAGARLPMRAR